MIAARSSNNGIKVASDRNCLFTSDNGEMLTNTLENRHGMAKKPTFKDTRTYMDEHNVQNYTLQQLGGKETGNGETISESECITVPSSTPLQHQIETLAASTPIPQREPDTLPPPCGGHNKSNTTPQSGTSTTIPTGRPIPSTVVMEVEDDGRLPPSFQDHVPDVSSPMPSASHAMNKSPPNRTSVAAEETAMATKSRMCSNGGLAEIGLGVRHDGSTSTFVVKATYKETITRFKLTCDSSFDELKEKVGKKLSL